MNPAAIAISFGGSVVILVILLFIVVGLSVLFYRYTLPPLPPRRRGTLSLLRTLALSLLLVIIFEPVFRLVRHHDVLPTIAVLVDASQSMSIRDGAGDRSAALHQFLNSDTRTISSPNTIVQYFPFDGTMKQPLPNRTDSIPLIGEITNISGALSQLKERVERDNIQSVLLVSDGNYTAGKNPLYDAEAIGVPIYTVGVGDTTEQKDVLVEKVITNNIAYAETRVPADVTIKSSGYRDENVEVTMSDGSTVIDRKIVKLSAGTNEYPLRLFVEPKDEGTKKFVVSVSKLPGELTERNNSHSFYVKVLRSKLRVMIFAGAPNPDIAAIRQALGEDQHFTVNAFVQKTTNEFYEGIPQVSALDSTDCFVFVGFPSAATSNSVLQQLHDIIEQQKKPLLFINNKATNYQKLQLFAQVLPFGWSSVSGAEVYVFPSIAERQKNHPLIMLEGGMTAEGWQQLPPIYKTQTVFHGKPEATVLASVKIQNIMLNEPLVAIRSISRQKSFAITGHGIWRWRLTAQGNAQTERFLPTLMVNVVRWLTTKDDDKNVRITPLKETFTTAEAVEFSGQVYDNQLRPVDHADVTVELSRGKERFQIQLNAAGNGRYEGSLDGLGEGEYAFVGKAVADGTMLGEDKGRFSVGQMNVEFLETKMNKALLEQIAYRTGGKYYDVHDAGTLGGDITRDVQFTPKEQIEANEIELWNWRYLAALIILLLATEWFLRKRSGML